MSELKVLEQWVAHQRSQERKRKRRYAHFDPKIRFTPKEEGLFRSYLMKPEKIARHAFYPFIRSDVVTPRFKKTGSVDERGRAIRKHEPKKRPIAYAAHFDAFIYSWYSHVLTARYTDILHERGIYNCVLAYLEKGKTNAHFAKDVFDFIKSKKNCVSIAFDIKSYFDSIDHEILLSVWKEVLSVNRLSDDHFNVYRSLTSYSYVMKEYLIEAFPEYKRSIKNKKSIKRICTPDEFRQVVRSGNFIEKNKFSNAINGSKRYSKICGIPQGSPISACLSNMYLIHFDQAMHQEVSKFGGLYCRYCDDIMIVAPENEAERITQFTKEALRRFEVEIQDAKTERTLFIDTADGLHAFDWTNGSQGRMSRLQYLGFEFDGQRVLLRSSSLARYHSRLKARVRETLKAAYGRNQISPQVNVKRLYKRYTETGKRNFITYAIEAAKVMDSPDVRRQVKGSMALVQELLMVKAEAFERRRSSPHGPERSQSEVSRSA